MAYAAIVLVAAGSAAAAGAELATPPSPPAPAREQVTALWREVAATLAPTLNASRLLLLGQRDPNGPSCVRPGRPKGVVFASRGGPGTRLANHWRSSVPDRLSPAADFAWHQGTLRDLLQDIRKQNEQVLPQTIRLAATADQLARALGGSGIAPGALAASPASQRTWPGYCAGCLVAALDRNDLAAARWWADELASATFALADLHRWLDYVVNNHLAAISFQARCKSLYLSCKATYSGQFVFDPTLSCLPGGRAGYCALRNCLEVERQAERLFRVPDDYLLHRLDGAAEPRRDGVDDVPAAGRMPPHLRSAFIGLRGHLSPAARQMWDLAARSPFNSSYLSNILYRTSTAGALDQLAVVLKRYDRAYAKPTQHGLMDVIFYRGGDPEGGYDWAERFEPRLMAAAATLGGSDEQVLLGAQHFTRALIGTADHYAAAPSLREALDANRFDCINATNLIGCLYRNAGRAGFYNIRWSAGAAGHSVPAAEVARSEGRRIVVVDGFDNAQIAAELWPRAYLSNRRWPPGYRGPKPDVYAAELYTRGLDNYIWVEGYILRGPHAGALARVPVPYLPDLPLPRATQARQRPDSNHAPPDNG